MPLREARRDDVPLIVNMLADDALGRGREQLTDMTPYLTAFDTLAADPNNTQYVWEEGGEVVGCLQLTFIPGLSQQGAWRAQVEGVRTLASRRSQGIGGRMMAAVIALAREEGCKSMQLTSNKSRLDAHRFYRTLGFETSHEGMKLKL